jgi:hypothetical protein
MKHIKERSEFLNEEHVAKFYNLINPMAKSRSKKVIFSGTYEECEKRREASGSKKNIYFVVPSY